VTGSQKQSHETSRGAGTMTSRRSLKTKLLRVTLSIVVSLSLATLACVGFMQYRLSEQSARDTEHLIRDSIVSKGRVLTANHALALRGLVEDNAFSDVSELVEKTVIADPDVLYGLFLANDGRPWAYASSAKGTSTNDPKRFVELGLSDADVKLEKSTQRNVRLFNQEVLEFAEPVVYGDEVLGTVRYGFSTDRMHTELRAADERASHTLLMTLLALAALALLNTLFGIVLASRASKNISQPLTALTEAANTIAEGRRDVRVTVNSDDELQILAGAFNHMLEVNQRAFEQLEEAMERALEAARLKSEFLANMSHEIRTPMNGVMGMVKLMLQMPLDGKLRRYAETIDASSTALLTIINDVLDFSKMEAGKYALQVMPFDPRLVVQDVAELLATRASEKGLELVYRVAPDVPSAFVGDPDRFRQVLNNLVGNAIKFTEHGEVFVELKVEAKSDSEVVLRVEVTDTGIGIAAKDIEGIFEAFSQVDGSLVRRHGGTGLGLAISKRLTEMMGGDLSVWSQPGMGSMFHFTAKGQVERPGVAADVGALGFPSGKRALIVETSRRGCDVINEHMRVWGLDSEAFHNVGFALARLDEAARNGKPFDVIVFGTHASGLETRLLLDFLNQRPELSSTPLIVLHQLGAGTLNQEARAQVAAQLSKPLRMSDLYNSLQDAFAGRREQNAAPHESNVPRRMRNERILVVEDNRINQFVAVEQLNHAGFEVDVANHGQEALDMLEPGKYGLVLMDCQMPVMDGYTATQEIRKREAGTGRHQVIIALTAHAMTGERDHVLSVGMDDYLSKPLRMNALEKMVARYLPASEPLPRVDGESAKGSDAPPADRAGVQARPTLDPQVRRSPMLIDTCLREMPKQLQAVIEALERWDAAELRAAAHKIKGSAMAIAADGMAEVAESLQRRAEEARLEDSVDLVAVLQQRFAEVETALTGERANNHNGYGPSVPPRRSAAPGG
jgi:signal transduction histidine kinase/CheY-like chemotaxis protein/HPt (histidine-containing phosphotransfer) domain-containing protein